MRPGLRCMIGSILTLGLACAQPAMAAKDVYSPDAARVAEIAGSLPTEPTGPGRPITDRDFWNRIAKIPVFQSRVAAARKVKDQPLAKLPDDLYLEFSQNGNRRNYEKVAFSRRNRLTPLVLAECIENKGEFLPALNTLIEELCKTRTWVLPAHDKKLTNFNNSAITIDLFSSALAWDLSMTDYLLGEKLKPEVRELLQKEVKRRVVGPFQASVHGKRTYDYWVKSTNNWNAVCFAGVTGAALIELDSPQERAEFIATAEHYSRYFLNGFSPDGYCSEGVGYWNYGYGRYSIMAQNFRLQTDGKIDFFTLDGAAAPAAYGPRIDIINEVYPAFADCSLAARPAPLLLWFLNRIYGWNNSRYAAEGGVPYTVDSLFESMLYYSESAHPAAPVKGVDISGAHGLRTAFEQAGVFICRPNPEGSGNFGVAFKGGSNAEHHNHNDIGSYVVVVGNKAVLLDPGPEAYTRRTFSKDRYVSKVLNSFGHAVPVVAGQLQRTGSKARAKVIRQDFTETTDTVTLEMKSAYDVKGLKSLTRTFEYGRTGTGCFVVTDHVEFESPQTFETAMISLDKFKQQGNATGLFTVGSEKAAVNVQIDASAAFKARAEKIDQEGTSKPNRLGIRLAEPVKSATVTMVISPN